MSRLIRPARPADAAAITRIQVRAWRAAYHGIVPAGVLEEVTGQQAQARWREHWRASIARPPTSRHHVLVEAEDDQLAAFAAFGPTSDPDRWPGTDAELYALHVDPDLGGRGHAGSLLTGVLDRLREDGFHIGCAWVIADDAPLRDLLASAGWRPDGARRDLDMGQRVPQVRLAADLRTPATAPPTQEGDRW